jgi:hypothetical protein
MSMNYLLNYYRYYLNPTWYGSLLKRTTQLRLDDCSGSNAVHIVPTCDVELDPPWFSRSWASRTDFGLSEGLADYLDIIGNWKADCTLFIEASILARYSDSLKEGRRYELGSHGYAHETYSNNVVARTANPVRLNLVERRKRIETSLNAIQRFSGIRPVSFRAPMLHIDGDSLRLLDELGIRADSSISNQFEGRVHPYHPSSSSWTGQRELGLLEFPVTVDPRPALASLFSRSPYVMFSHPQRRITSVVTAVRAITSLCARLNLPTIICIISHVWEFSESVTRKLGFNSFFPRLLEEIASNFEVTFSDMTSACDLWDRATLENGRENETSSVIG